MLVKTVNFPHVAETDTRSYPLFLICNKKQPNLGFYPCRESII